MLCSHLPPMAMATRGIRTLRRPSAAAVHAESRVKAAIRAKASADTDSPSQEHEQGHEHEHEQENEHEHEQGHEQGHEHEHQQASDIGGSSTPTWRSARTKFMKPVPKPLEGPITGGPFRIERSATGGLPVYSDWRRDGSCKTIVRKIEGDVVHFQHQLNRYLRENHIDPLRPPPQATLRPTNMNLVIKGKHTTDVRNFITSRGY